MTRCRALGLGWVFLTLAVSGCSTSYKIQVVDGLPREVYLTYSKRAEVKVGDSFVLYQYHSSPGTGVHQGHGGGSQVTTKHELARVQVVTLVDDLHAVVRVLSGQVEDGLEAEKFR